MLGCFHLFIFFAGYITYSGFLTGWATFDTFFVIFFCTCTVVGVGLGCISYSWPFNFFFYRLALELLLYIS